MDAFRVAEARFRTQPDQSNQLVLVAAAVDLLQRGFDTPALRTLAGEGRADPDEVEHYLSLTIRELGLGPLSARERVLMIATALARDLVEHRLNAPDAARMLWQLYAPNEGADYPDEFVQLAMVADGVEDLPDIVPEADLYEAARAFLWSRR